MDTNCFSHYCEGGKVAGFDYDKIRDFVESEGYWVVITPYTLYECVQDLVEPKNIIEERDKWFNARDFWVLNVNRLIGDKYNFEYGMDFLFEFGFDPNNLEAFIKKRNEWRDKVFESLAPRIALLSQIIAIIYVMITERKENGKLSQTSLIKLAYIDQGGMLSLKLNERLGEFVNNPARYSKELADAKEVNARDYLVLFVKNLALLMLTNARYLIGQLGRLEIVLTFNDPRFVEGVTRRMYPHDEMVKGETIKIFNYGNCRRDFTYVDDIVEGIVRVMKKAPERKKGEDGLPVPPYKIYNIGGGQPENLLDFVQILQEELLRAGVLPQDYDFEAHKELVPMQPGDVPTTYADASALERDFGFTPKITLREGLRKFAEWYKEYYG